MDIRLNGKPRDVREGITVSGLLEELALHAQRVAVMVNDEIVKRDRFGEVALQPGDRVEVLTIMAGG
jgi:sulfur carrier protein